MKKIIFASAMLLFAATSTFAQDEELSFTKGSSTVAVGYGFASPFKTLFKLSSAFGALDPGISTKFSSVGPIALTYEYGATEKISVGVQVGFGSIKNVTTEVDGLGTGKPYISTETLKQLSIMARGNYHFGKGGKFDPYVGAGLGYGNFKYEVKTNDPTDTPADLSTFKIAVPGAFGFTGQIGAKYYFSPKFGAYAEVGYLAGSLAQIGFVAKF